MTAFVIEQVPGNIPRSHPVDGIAESLVKSKKYLVPMAFLAPEVTGGVVVAYLADAGNDLEAPASHFAPVIEDVLAALGHEPACVLAQMSGSGATCFGLFDGPVYAAGAAERIAQEHRHWWVRATRIAAPDIGAPQWIG